jgi:NADH-quinone oxidoreductase subunit G
MEGTFTNVNHRVQRFWPALHVPGMARPAWQILGVLLAGIEGVNAPATPEDAFELLGEVRAEFGDLSWGEVGAQGQDLRMLDAVAGD